jgi:hypothetical protein
MKAILLLLAAYALVGWNDAIDRFPEARHISVKPC